MIVGVTADLGQTNVSAISIAGATLSSLPLQSSECDTSQNGNLNLLYLQVHSLFFPITQVMRRSPFQTNEKSITALKDIDPVVVLLAGDLSYADGWVSLWDGNKLD